MSTSPFALLLPVKDSSTPKSRLQMRDEDQRRALMRAFVLDALAAASRSRAIGVFVVGDHRGIPGCIGLPDEGRGDLNVALARAAARINNPEVGIAVLLADLPCLITSDLDQALSVSERSFVADAAGTGTTMLLAPAGEPLDPLFGVDSASRHLASGARPLTADLPTLRRDVDTAEDLRAAILLGVGQHTREVLDDGKANGGTPTRGAVSGE